MTTTSRTSALGQGRQRLVGDVGDGELRAGLGQHARDVHGDVADPDDQGGVAVQPRVQVGEVGVAVVPGDEVRRRHAAVEVLARDAQPPIQRRPVGEHGGVVMAAQVVRRQVAADLDVPEEAQRAGPP